MMSIRLELDRQALAPEVSQWKAYESKLQHFQEQKLEYLTALIASLQSSLASLQMQVCPHEYPRLSNLMSTPCSGI